MAASVQELLLAAQAKQEKSPLTALAEMITAGQAGYSKGVADKRANALAESELSEAEMRRQTLLSQLLLQKQQQENNDRLRAEMEGLVATQSETGIRDRLSSTQAPGQPSTPKGKVEKEFSVDEKGNITKKVKVVSGQEPTKPQTFDKAEYVDPVTKEKKIGKWDSLQGKLITSPDDPLAEITKVGTADSVQTTFKLYETARDGMMEGLKNSETGPIIGRMPALTEEQQIAEGGVSAMAPVLKQIFRVAGEGTFTDKDQTLLLNMVPTRKDKPAAAEAKIKNIDKIVKAKLGMSNDTPGSSSGVKRIKVIRLSDNKSGTINESDFNPEKYKRAE